MDPKTLSALDSPKDARIRQVHVNRDYPKNQERYHIPFRGLA